MGYEREPANHMTKLMPRPEIEQMMKLMGHQFVENDKVKPENGICSVFDENTQMLDKCVCPASVKTTPQMTRFRDVQQAIFVATVSIDDDEIKSDCNFKKKLGLRTRGETERYNGRHQ